jgi:hypothetical protein
LCILLQNWDKCICVNVRSMSGAQSGCLSFRFTTADDTFSDAASFAAAFKRMRAAGKESEARVPEPMGPRNFALPLHARESDSPSAVQVQLQVNVAPPRTPFD